MMFNLDKRMTRGVAALLAACVLGGSAAAVAAGTGGKSPPTPSAKVAQAGSSKAHRASTVPASLKRAETAAEDVIGYLAKGKPAKSQAEARLLKELAHGKAATALHKGASRRPRSGGCRHGPTAWRSCRSGALQSCGSRWPRTRSHS